MEFATRWSITTTKALRGREILNYASCKSSFCTGRICNQSLVIRSITHNFDIFFDFLTHHRTEFATIGDTPMAQPLLGVQFESTLGMSYHNGSVLQGIISFLQATIVNLGIESVPPSFYFSSSHMLLTSFFVALSSSFMSFECRAGHCLQPLSVFHRAYFGFLFSPPSLSSSSGFLHSSHIVLIW